MLKLLSAFALAGLIATTAGCIYYAHDHGHDRGWDNDRHSHHDRWRDNDRDDRRHRKGHYR